MPHRNAFPETRPAWAPEDTDLSGGVPSWADPVEEIAAAWVAAGKRAPQSPGPAWSCAVKACRGMSFVRIETALGRKSLCLCHFDSISRRLRYQERAGSEDRLSRAAESGGQPM